MLGADAQRARRSVCPLSDVDRRGGLLLALALPALLVVAVLALLVLLLALGVGQGGRLGLRRLQAPLGHGLTLRLPLRVVSVLLAGLLQRLVDVAQPRDDGSVRLLHLPLLPGIPPGTGIGLRELARVPLGPVGHQPERVRRVERHALGLVARLRERLGLGLGQRERGAVPGTAELLCEELQLRQRVERVDHALADAVVEDLEPRHGAEARGERHPADARGLGDHGLLRRLRFLDRLHDDVFGAHLIPPKLTC